MGQLARQQGLESAHCVWPSGALGNAQAQSLGPASRWGMEHEEPNRLKLLLIYTKGRPSQVALSEEEVGLFREWQRVLGDDLASLDDETT